MSRKLDNARALAAAGADPWRTSLGGWSPGRLSLAGPTPDLFAVPDDQCLTEAEHAAAEEARRLLGALGDLYYEGTGLACVAGIDAAEAIHRLEATPVPDERIEAVLEEPYTFARGREHQGPLRVPGAQRCRLHAPDVHPPDAAERGPYAVGDRRRDDRRQEDA